MGPYRQSNKPKQLTKNDLVKTLQSFQFCNWWDKRKFKGWEYYNTLKNTELKIQNIKVGLKLNLLSSEEVVESLLKELEKIEILNDEMFHHQTKKVFDFPLARIVLKIKDETKFLKDYLTHFPTDISKTVGR